jgi:hypothetical protein
VLVWQNLPHTFAEAATHEKSFLERAARIATLPVSFPASAER